MSICEADNPYRAGPGLIPPHLAGRTKEQEVIKGALDLIQGKEGPMDRSPHAPSVLVGPRGVGKAALIGSAIREAKARDIHAALITKSMLESPQTELVCHMFSDIWLITRFAEIEKYGSSIHGSVFNVGNKDTQNLLSSALPEFLSERPLLLVLVEAQQCDPKRLNLLLESIHVCMLNKLPLAVVLAGTPGLEPLLQKCEASFVERYNYMAINTLEPEVAKEALEVPARQDGLAMEPDALELLLDWSECYPYFLQLAGAGAWSAAKMRGGDAITQQDVKSGLQAAEKKKLKFFDKRIDEIMDNGILDPAKRIARIFNDGDPGLSRGKLAEDLCNFHEVIDFQVGLQVVDCLLDSGFLWREALVIEPGTPNMFDYVRQID